MSNFEEWVDHSCWRWVKGAIFTTYPHFFVPEREGLKWQQQKS